MADRVEVVVPAVEEEAKKWRELADGTQPIAEKADGLWLALTAFWLGSMDPIVQYNTYKQYQERMAKYLGQAAKEFDEIGTALKKVAAEIDRVDSVNAVDIWKFIGTEGQ